ncbi:MAG: ABC transporter permease [Sedimentisphaerales bacterium]|nr:ABC transporter permease [Sedimentisphaerales bacterium]
MKTLLGLPLAFLAVMLQSMRLALGQIWTNKTRSVLTTIGIVIGIASVTAVIAALTGLKAKILKEFETFGTNKIYVVPDWPEEGRLRHASWRVIRFQPEQFDHLLEHCPSIERFTRVCRSGQKVQVGDESLDDVRITGINPDWHRIEDRSVVLGRPFSVADESQTWQVCLITPKVRDKLKLDRDCTGQMILVGQRGFRIVGVVEEMVESAMFGGGGAQNEILIPFDTAWKIYEPFMYVIAASRSPEVSDEARAELRFYLRQVRKLKPEDPDTFRLEVIEKYIQEFKKLALFVTAIAGGIVGISLLVGGVGIMNIMLVSVSERTREIGLRKAVGARPSAILLQFLVEAVMLCLFGGLIGVGAGQLLTKAIASIPNANLDQAYIPLWAIGVAFGFSALVGVFFGMFPAVKAARLDPIEALRHE